MEACVDFLPSPTPTVAAMRTAKANFENLESIFKMNPSTLNKDLRNKAHTEIILMHLSWIDYAQPLIGSDTVKAERLGYPAHLERSKATIPEGVPPKPTFELTPNPGEIVLKTQPYKQEKKAIFYNWQVSEDNGATWSNLPVSGNSHRRKITLELGKVYWFRVAYATTAGEGPKSDYVEVYLTADMIRKPKRRRAA